MDKKEIGAKLREYRKKCGLDAKDVSNRLLNQFNITLADKSLYNYETGRTSPTPNVLLALCSIYGVRDILCEFDVSADLGNALMDAPLAKTVGIGHWMDRALIGSDFTEDEWLQLERFAEFLIYLRDKPAK